MSDEYGINDNIKEEIVEFIRDNFPKDLASEELMQQKFMDFAFDHWGGDLKSLLIDFLGYRLSLHMQRAKYDG